MSNTTKIITSIAAACACTIVGCKTIESLDEVKIVAKSIGTSTGLVLNCTKIDDTSRNTIVDVVNKVEYWVPQTTNETIVSYAVPRIQNEVIDPLVKEGKLDETQATLIMGQVLVIAKGADYMIDKRCPVVRTYVDGISVAMNSFADGFLSVFKPANTTSASTMAVEYDQQAYDYIVSLSNK